MKNIDVKLTLDSPAPRVWMGKASHGGHSCDGSGSTADVAASKAVGHLIRIMQKLPQQESAALQESTISVTHYIKSGKKAGTKCRLIERLGGPDNDEEWSIELQSGKKDVEKLRFMSLLTGIAAPAPVLKSVK